ncbi:major capsid protein [Corynebacterium sputi]|uniref:major capsid protein n=1 Tax=Corynebacterium sputi TaxID=489915 RepID=UPI00042997D8|nr:major capsid protein [Corynebacterium sputi]
MGFYPGSADIDAGRITVDQALNDPTIIESKLAELIEPNLIVENLFSEGGQVDGGAVIFAPITEKHLYTDNDVQDRNPGDEYPVVFRTRPESQIARVQDFGGKFPTSDEARRRNKSIDFDSEVQALSNTIVRKINQRAIETVTATVTAAGDDMFQVSGLPWDEAIATGNPTSMSDPRQLPHALFAAAQADAQRRELGVAYTRLVLSPNAYSNLRICYGPDLGTMLSDYGLEAKVSNHLPADTAYMVDPTRFGFIQYEEGLTVTTWRDEHHRQTWTQAYAMPVMGSTMPSALAILGT